MSALPTCTTRRAVASVAPAEGLALLMAHRAGVLPLPFVLAWAVAVALHLGLGGQGRAVLGAKWTRALGACLAALMLVLLARRLGDGGTSALRGILEITCAAQTLLHLGGRSPLGVFVGLLLSSVHVAGAGIIARDLPSLALGGAYVVALAFALLCAERLGERRPQPLPLRALLLPMVWVLVLGFPLGLGAYLLAPRDLFAGLGSASASAEGRSGDAYPGADEANADRPRFALTGPDLKGSGVPFGSVAEIQRDLTPWFHVREEGAAGVPRGVFLRDNVHDYFFANGALEDTLSRARSARRYLDAHDGVVDGWIPLGQTDDPVRGRTLEITVLRGGHRRLYVMPEAVRVQILRDGKPRAGLDVLRSANETLDIVGEFAAGDVMRMRVVPVRTQDADLVGRRSDSAVAPLGQAYVQLPGQSAVALSALARSVVGGEQDAWRRARLLEAWLKGPDFTYTLAVPKLDEQGLVVDFLLRSRRGHCGCYAMSLCLLLRSLGHPTRYVRGFWGGDAQEQHASLLLRGSHYHAWTEMFVDGIGWVPLNPTPPDRLAADAGSRTVESASPQSEAPLFSLLDHDAAQWDRWFGRAKGALARSASRTREVMYGPGAGWVGWWGPVLLGLLIAGWRRRVVERQRLAPAGGAVPRGPYGDALRLLARRGLVRRRQETLGDFQAQVALAIPDAALAFDQLTRARAEQVYGVRSVELEPQEAAVLRLKQALMHRPPAPVA